MSKRRGFGAIRRLPSKRYQASYIGPDLKRHIAPETYETREDAEAWLAKCRREILGEEWRPPAKPGPPLMFAEFAERWLSKQELKPKTVEQYRWLLDDWIGPTFGAVPLKRIDRDAVDDWHGGLPKSKKTARAHAYGLLRTILGDAADRRMIDYNPCQIRGASNVKRKKKIKTASLDELASLVLAMPEKHRLMVMLAAWCALRFGELTELRRSDIDLVSGVISVERGVVRLRGGVRKVDTPKSEAGIREVHIPPHLLPMVRDHLAASITGGRDGLLFPAVDGRHLSSSSFYGTAPGTKDKRTGRLLSPWGYYAARVAAGRPDLRFHDLRHTGATLAAATGATLKELMARLGHSTPAAALLYQHATSEGDAKIARKLSEMAAAG